jgi:hypothetical protein
MKYVHACITASDGRKGCLWYGSLACVQPTSEGGSAYSAMCEFSKTYHPITCAELMMRMICLITAKHGRTRHR